jgi:cell division protein FtsL
MESSQDPTLSFSSKSRPKRFWENRTSMEKVLLVLCAVVCLVSLVLIIVLATSKQKQSGANIKISSASQKKASSGSNDVCTTKTCIKESARVLAWMNNATNP